MGYKVMRKEFELILQRRFSARPVIRNARIEVNNAKAQEGLGRDTISCGP